MRIKEVQKQKILQHHLPSFLKIGFTFAVFSYFDSTPVIKEKKLK